MADSSIPGLVDDSPAGIFAVHPPRLVLPVLVAPTTEAKPDAFNTIRRDLVTVACGNFPESASFEFDSSVVVPAAQASFRKLAALVKRHADCPASVFGHADPVGDDGYNKWLSDRRARAIFAVLVRKVAVWEKLHDTPEGAPGDVWGLKSMQVMLQGLGHEPGNLDGKSDPQTKSAIRAFLNGDPPTPGVPPTAPPTGTDDAATRKKLYAAYMDFLCRETDDPASPTFKMEPEQFLGGGKGKGDHQGCSEFNPQLILTKDEETELAKSGDEGKAVRNAANAPNRRVIVFLFRRGTKIDTAKWPCPSAAEGIGGCKKRFWSNGEDRRKTRFDEHRRRFGRHVPASKAVLTPPNPTLATAMAQEETTFACRFYHGFALGSPCERDLKMWALRLKTDGHLRLTVQKGPEPSEPIPLAATRFVVQIGETKDSPVLRGKTPADGVIAVPTMDPVVRMLLKVDAYGTADERPKDEEEKDAGDSRPNDAPPDPNVAPDVELDDGKPFPDEDTFLVLRLDGGSLRRVRRSPEDDPDEPDPDDAEINLGARQRLYNLGYGLDNFADWSDADLQRFLQRFQRDEKLKDTGALDDPTIAALIARYGS